jgi:hypothetical protein
MDKVEAKAEYKAPQLEVFGSVRNLTGGSGGTNFDGGASRTLR